MAPHEHAGPHDPDATSHGYSHAAIKLILVELDAMLADGELDAEHLNRLRASFVQRLSENESAD